MTADAACKGIRDHDQDGSIGLFAEEPNEPYARPPLTKGLWKGKDEDSIWRGTPELTSTSTRAGRSPRSTSTRARPPTTPATRTRTSAC